MWRIVFVQKRLSDGGEVVSHYNETQQDIDKIMIEKVCLMLYKNLTVKKNENVFS